MKQNKGLIYQSWVIFILAISFLLQNCMGSPKTEHDTQKEKNIIPSLYVAIERGDIKEVNNALQAGGIDVNSTNGQGLSPLYIASLKGHIDVANKLIDCGAKVQDNLYMAIGKLDLAVAKQLVLLGADVNVKNKYNQTLLHLATSHNQSEKIKLLLLLEIDINAKCVNGWSALQLAALHGHMEIVRLLIEHGADVNSKDNKDFTPLYIAVVEGHVQLAKLLIAHGANINANLYTSILKEHPEVSRALALLSMQ
ncbi:MAG: ankyrin repeat domain-containing protein [Candidatus Amoebophilus sp.]